MFGAPRMCRDVVLKLSPSLGGTILPSKLGFDFLHVFAEGFPVFAGKGVIGGQALYRFSHGSKPLTSSSVPVGKGEPFAASRGSASGPSVALNECTQDFVLP